MFNSTAKKITKTALVIAVLMGASMGAHADSLIPSDLTSNIEKNIAAQMQDMMQVAQTELSLSLQTQLSEAMFEMNSNEDVSQLAQEQSEKVITSAMVKE
ncbi:hypothetical protein FM038_021450 [Shewanella eurypsychrophilus]|uniref:Uncharacterized protein n=1 Tax=Shewanella eurypsychrophilus TaxID=2593656 RepID=A0ABX6VBB1_9GAMM|nr:MULTISPECIES: hypothetical protein [Shewanella]QFU24454.1 hypothetical protein FS418_23145 [Shewanella sp. YLB-09]QPG59654.1 hypothetical protein FM038_021450 [Shewanella eurypsychrophilus]